MKKLLTSSLLLLTLSGCGQSGLSPASLPAPGVLAARSGAPSASGLVTHLELKITKTDPLTHFGATRFFEAELTLSRGGTVRRLRFSGHEMDTTSPWTHKPLPVTVMVDQDGKQVLEDDQKALLLALRAAKVAKPAQKQELRKLLTFFARSVEEHEAFKKATGKRK